MSTVSNTGSNSSREPSALAKFIAARKSNGQQKKVGGRANGYPSSKERATSSSRTATNTESPQEAGFSDSTSNGSRTSTVSKSGTHIEASTLVSSPEQELQISTTSTLRENIEIIYHDGAGNKLTDTLTFNPLEIDGRVHDAHETIRLNPEDELEKNKLIKLELGSTLIQRAAELLEARKMAVWIKDAVKSGRLDYIKRDATIISNEHFERAFSDALTGASIPSDCNNPRIKALTAYSLLKNTPDPKAKDSRFLDTFPTGFFETDTLIKTNRVMKMYLIDGSRINTQAAIMSSKNLIANMHRDGLGVLFEHFDFENLIHVTFPGYAVGKYPIIDTEKLLDSQVNETSEPTTITVDKKTSSPNESSLGFHPGAKLYPVKILESQEPAKFEPLVKADGNLRVYFTGSDKKIDSVDITYDAQATSELRERLASGTHRTIPLETDDEKKSREEKLVIAKKISAEVANNIGSVYEAYTKRLKPKTRKEVKELSDQLKKKAASAGSEAEKTSLLSEAFICDRVLDLRSKVFTMKSSSNINITKDVFEMFYANAVRNCELGEDAVSDMELLTLTAYACTEGESSTLRGLPAKLIDKSNPYFTSSAKILFRNAVASACNFTTIEELEEGGNKTGFKWQNTLKNARLKTLCEKFNLGELIKLSYPHLCDGTPPLLRYYYAAPPSWKVVEGDLKREENADLNAVVMLQSTFVNEGCVNNDGTYNTNAIRDKNWGRVLTNKEHGCSGAYSSYTNVSNVMDALTLAAPTMIGTSIGQIPRWEFEWNGNWDDGTLSGEIVKYAVEVDKNCTVEIDGVRYVCPDKIKAVSNWNDVISNKHSAFFKNSGYDTAPEALMGNYPELFGYEEWQVKPWEIEWSGMWNDDQGCGSALLQQAFAYYFLDKDGESGNVAELDTTQSPPTITISKIRFNNWYQSSIAGKYDLRDDFPSHLNSAHKIVAGGNSKVLFDKLVGLDDKSTKPGCRSIIDYANELFNEYGTKDEEDQIIKVNLTELKRGKAKPRGKAKQEEQTQPAKDFRTRFRFADSSEPKILVTENTLNDSSQSVSFQPKQFFGKPRNGAMGLRMVRHMRKHNSLAPGLQSTWDEHRHTVIGLLKMAFAEIESLDENSLTVEALTNGALLKDDKTITALSEYLVLKRESVEELLSSIAKWRLDDFLFVNKKTLDQTKEAG